MNRVTYTDKTAKEIVEKFCAHVHWLVIVRHTYKVLFEDEQPSCKTLMEKTASSFFVDLNRILHEYLLLECAKITDDASTFNHENFTVAYLVENIGWPQKQLTSMPDEEKDILKELKSLQGITEGFRFDIKSARDKLLAHLDKAAVLSGEPHGAFPEGKDEAFFDALQKICNITHEACFGTIYGDMSTVAGGDVIDFRRALACAVAFEEALSESSGQKEMWLYSRLEKARQPKALPPAVRDTAPHTAE
jgi:AbiU2